MVATHARDLALNTSVGAIVLTEGVPKRCPAREFTSRTGWPRTTLAGSIWPDAIVMASPSALM